MPTVIAIEAKPVELEGINTGFYHLYLVKTATDSQGRVLSEKVIRGTAESDGSLGTLANADLATSPDRRGSDTPQERHRTLLDLGGRSAEDVWSVMVQHANNIDVAHRPYSIDIFREFPGSDLNSNSVVASVLHTVGIDWSQNFPIGISPREAPLYGQIPFMNVNDRLVGTNRSDVIFGGVGNDAIYGGSQADKLAGESGHDNLRGGGGNDWLYGGSGDDNLAGQHGRDALRGDAGRDAFVFNTPLQGISSVDSIADFSVADDTIWLDNLVFTALGAAGSLNSGKFWVGGAAHDATDRIIYDPVRGLLNYDPDGNGAASHLTITKISKGLSLTAADILVV